MTDTIQHHLSDALLMAYSAGTLPEAFSLTVAAHVSMCDECRARLGAFDTVGGALIEQTETVQMAEDSFEATMARINNAEPEPQARPVRRGGLLPGIEPHVQRGVMLEAETP